MACQTSMRFRVTHVPCILAVVLALILSALVALPCAAADEMPTEGDVRR